MKHALSTLIFIFLFNLLSTAQAPPEGFNYQAIARDINGATLNNQAVTIRESIRSGSASGNLEWQEMQMTSTNAQGLFNIVIGTGTTTGAGSKNSFSMIDWGSNTFYVGIEINLGTGFINMGSQQLMSVPYSLYSKKTKSIPDGVMPGQILVWNGTQWVAQSICSLFDSDVNNCGSCHGVCPTPANGTPVCNNGVCDFVCNTGYSKVGNACLLNGSPGTPCNGNGDCISGICMNGICQPVTPTCTDLIHNGNETDVDCGGGTCPPCSNGKACLSNLDCSSGFCQFGICNTGSCVDAVKDGSETDVDCGGGNCPPCNSGKNCNTNSDCISGLCQFGICGVASCTDAVHNGSETDVDCGGGNCPPCILGKACNVNSDCQSGTCTFGICQTPSCSDMVHNGSETDIDCGGGSCPPCQTGKACNSNSDCVSGHCQFGVCFAPTCSDTIKNGSETDVDCGGGQCMPCSLGKNCFGNGDCLSGHCSSGICVP